MHGAGIRAMGRLMDRMMAAIDPGHADAAAQVRADLALLAPALPVDLGPMGGAGPALERDPERAPAHSRTVQFPHPHLPAGQGCAAMKFFFPDSQDQIDPGFDFGTEERSALRVRQRDDLYAHEALDGHVIDGLLVSKAIVDGLPGACRQVHAAPNGTACTGTASGDSSASTRLRPRDPDHGRLRRLQLRPRGRPAVHPGPGHRLLRRMRLRPRHLRRPRHPRLRPRRRHRPASPQAQRMAGPAADSRWTWPDASWPGARPGRSGSSRSAWPRAGARPPMRRRSANSRKSATRGSPSAAWSRSRPTRSSPASGRSRRRATPAPNCTCWASRGAATSREFASYGVTSFDSTSAFRQAFKDDKDNYHTVDRTYTAIRVPQVDGNPKLKKQILAGRVDQEDAIRTRTGMPAGAARIRCRRDRRPASHRCSAALQRNNRASETTHAAYRRCSDGCPMEILPVQHMREGRNQCDTIPRIGAKQTTRIP